MVCNRRSIAQSPWRWKIGQLAISSNVPELTIKGTNILKSGGCLEFVPCIIGGTC
jgi:hypothetical protein